jgi:hypothetical protein
MPDGRKEERAATRRLSPRAWRPVEVRLEIEGRARKFWVHPDSRVYEEYRSSMRRVKDQELRARVLHALGQRRDDLRRAQERTRAIVEGK